MRSRDWSSDVCSSDLSDAVQRRAKRRASAEARKADRVKAKAIGREWKLKRKQEKAHARAAARAEYKAAGADGRKREEEAAKYPTVGKEPARDALDRNSAGKATRRAERVKHGGSGQIKKKKSTTKHNKS